MLASKPPFVTYDSCVAASSEARREGMRHVTGTFAHVGKEASGLKYSSSGVERERRHFAGFTARDSS